MVPGPGRGRILLTSVGMKAVVCHEIGSIDKLVVEEVATPEPGPGQVRVAIRAAGASFVDGLMVAGRYQFPMQAPYTPGGEAAGVVDAVGAGVDGFAVGDRVFASTGSGAFADAVAGQAPSAGAAARRPRLRPRARRSCRSTARRGSRSKHRTVVRPGEVVLVTGAGGGVGLAAIDVARSLGARVIAVASSEEKRAAGDGHGRRVGHRLRSPRT